MNRLLVLLMVLLVNMVANAQTEKRIYTQAEQESAQHRKLQKRLEAIHDSVNYVNAVNALKKLDFVLEADRLVFKRGETAYVTSNTNFISLSDDKAVIQIAPFNGGGPNGVGGIPLEGRASNIKLKTDKKGNVTFSMMVQGVAVSANVTIRMVKGTNKCTATVSPNFNSNRISFTGYLYPSDQSNVFKGRAI